ncbi:MAG: serine/threonine-protein kinase, partial [Acidobacteria bacterium]|nr:serine/threonine-protein kinase [Acidobacteriota bacterium]
MVDENWQKVREIFDSALRRKPEERRKFVSQACGEDKSLLVEVESLLSSLDSADSFLETPAVAKVADVIESETKKLERGTCFGHYEIIEQIGEGGMGEVYLAKDTNLNRKVALKLLAAHITEDKTRVSRFRQEAFATSALNHPNIVTIYEIGEWRGRDFIATEFIEGITLRSLLRKKKLSLGEALNIALQIASALAAAHGAGIVHRDIKPENIMIRPDGLVKVLDFGIAKYRPTETGRKALVETEVGEVIGTAAYMSPEQARGLEIDAQTDIWSLGVILYEMIARKLPFPGQTKSDRIAAILEHEPAPLTKINRKVSPQFQQIVASALAKDKRERYTKMAEMAEDLRLLRETTGDKLSSPFILPARKPAASHRAYLFAVFALAVLLVGAIGLGFYFSDSGKTAVSDKKSIVVLPLKPINMTNRDEIYEIGIADSLIHRLGSMKGFVVRPLSATRKYADINQDPIAAGREQQVDYVLASNYQLAGGRIRVTSQFFNVTSGQIEETYKSEKDAGDIFAMQDAVADEVGKLLLARFAFTLETPAARRGTENEEAYRLYLQGMYFYDRRTATDSRKAVETLERAVRLDPNYA